MLGSRRGTELRVFTIRAALHENLELSSMKSKPLISDRSRKCDFLSVEANGSNN